MVSIPSELKHVFKEGMSLIPVYEKGKISYVLEGYIPQTTEQPKQAIERKVIPLPSSQPETELEQQTILEQQTESQVIPLPQKDAVQKGVERLVGDIMDRIMGKSKEKSENEELTI